MNFLIYKNYIYHDEAINNCIYIIKKAKNTNRQLIHKKLTG